MGGRLLDTVVLTHVPFEGPAQISTWLQAQGHRVTIIPVYSWPASIWIPIASRADILVVMGGPMGVYQEHQCPWLPAEVEFLADRISSGGPTIGVCLGAQLLARAAGAAVYPHRIREIGWWPVEICAGSTIGVDDPASVWRDVFSKVDEHPVVFHWHGDTYDLPPGSIQIARSRGCDQQGFVIGDRIIGLQFHLEGDSRSIASMYEAGAGEISGGLYESGPRQYPASATHPILYRILEQLERAAVTQ